MFGMGFFEIVMVAVVAIIFLGPEKLPCAIVDIAKFIKALKKSIQDAKDTLDSEINLHEIRDEALAYKNSLSQEFKQGMDNLTKEIDLKEIPLDSAQDSSKQQEPLEEPSKQKPSHA